MARRLTLRLLAVVLILAVGALGIHAATHWHANGYDELHCQACQMGHAAVPQSVVHVAAQVPLPVVRFKPAEESTPDLGVVQTLSAPRAPPA